MFSAGNHVFGAGKHVFYSGKHVFCARKHVFCAGKRADTTGKHLFCAEKRANDDRLSLDLPGRQRANRGFYLAVWWLASGAGLIETGRMENARCSRGP